MGVSSRHVYLFRGERGDRQQAGGADGLKNNIPVHARTFRIILKAKSLVIHKFSGHLRNVAALLKCH